MVKMEWSAQFGSHEGLPLRFKCLLNVTHKCFSEKNHQFLFASLKECFCVNQHWHLLKTSWHTSNAVAMNWCFLADRPPTASLPDQHSCTWRTSQSKRYTRRRNCVRRGQVVASHNTPQSRPSSNSGFGPFYPTGCCPIPIRMRRSYWTKRSHRASVAASTTRPTVTRRR